MSTLFGYEVVEQAQEIDRLSTEIASLTKENERLRRLVRMAYVEGWGNAEHPTAPDFYSNWLKSETLAALQPKEGE